MQAKQRVRTNSAGFFSNIDYHPNGAQLAVIGDSYVEAKMIPAEQRLATRLGKALGAGESVYGLGGSGFSASNYLMLARLAAVTYGSKTLVFLIHDHDFSESFSPTKGNFGFKLANEKISLYQTPFHISKLEETVAHSRLGYYVFSNLKFRPEAVYQDVVNDIRRFIGRPVATKKKLNRDKVERGIDFFLSEIDRLKETHGITAIFLIDPDRVAMYKNKPAHYDDPMAYFIQNARQRGFTVRDLTPAFTQDYEKYRTPLDFLPIDYHWNPRAQSIAAKEALSAIQDHSDAPNQP